MNDIYKIETNPLCNKENIVQGDNYRFTVLTPEMIRMEYSDDGLFEDRATQKVINRDFDVQKFKVIDEENNLEIITGHVHLIYDKKRFSKNGLILKVRGNTSNYQSIWHFGEEIHDLKGTARTLDGANGAIPLERGLLSVNGYSVIDDSQSLVLTEDGWVEPRKKSVTDIYFLGYGREYLHCLKDFFKLCGNTPLLPKYALGNWWSRYYRYTEEEYKELIERFQKEKIPFTVAVIDMDWHLVDIDPKYGSGWTGYTWNKELFPDPKEFMGWLHQKGLKVTLNVHPADGIRAHEEMYLEMAKALKVDYASEEDIQFNISDPAFLEAYFKYAHHPNEENGVDFWWVDWQQGNNSKIEGLDPLWMLNHYHFLDSKRNGKRPMTFSRYAGIGSHRYPIGFSGDSFITWETLDFEPYFTANASNAGYGWWSHDIGGHMLGVKDDEMAARWLQFGVFSPIMRLHSSASLFNGKEPWRYKPEIHETMNRFLRLRHSLIPYIYTMNRIFNVDGVPLIQPMYYHNSEIREAYEVPNEYYFGTELIACPITRPINSRIERAKVKAWLPKGTYIDMFNGMIYDGGRNINLYRDINHIPILAKAGAIIPMADMEHCYNELNNPEDMEVRIFAGDNGSFTMYEDDGDSLQYLNGKYVETEMNLYWNKAVKFEIKPAAGDSSVIPEERNYVLKYIGFTDCKAVTVKSDNKDVAYEKEYDSYMNMITIRVNSINTKSGLTVEFNGSTQLSSNDINKRIFDFLNQAQIEFELKDRIYNIVKSDKTQARIVGRLQAMELDEDLFGALCEIILAY
ncbi:glycoside hydrolase family 31 protein [Clostridium oryzae]|uniref:Alpha-xylosidase BoGH31A n=1 Tax=Clostridium oryzae TaxID=1450648 RepID=A0A1V4IN25_9CLOT|nr:glycoside hydrolase family 31 protein [Clostridium oryzae]OPJ61175.1 alpha-xylosidase BoGH31A precursor [Clostridium oryzae]